MFFNNKEINILQWNVPINADKDGCYTAVLQVEMPLLEKDNKEHKFLSFCTSEAMRLVKKEFEFQTLDIVSPCTIFNNVSSLRKGTWVFYGKFLVCKSSEWLYKNMDALKSVQNGLQQALELTFEPGSPLEEKQLVESLERVDSENKSAIVVSKSTTKRVKTQKDGK